jgi:hypothetical protein
MNIAASRFVAGLSRTFDTEFHSTALWVAWFAALSLFLILDIVVVARAMLYISPAHLAAALFAFLLIVSGLLVTIWEMERSSHVKPRRR